LTGFAVFIGGKNPIFVSSTKTSGAETKKKTFYLQNNEAAAILRHGYVGSTGQRMMTKFDNTRGCNQDFAKGDLKLKKKCDDILITYFGDII